MISNLIVLADNILAYETVLKLEYTEQGTEAVINSAIRRLEYALGIQIAGKTLDSILQENSNFKNIVETLVTQILDCSKTTACIFMCGMFNHNLPVALSSVKYLGLGKEALQLVLRYFQNSAEYDATKDAIPQLCAGLDGITMCTVKRLFIIMLTLDRLGVRDGAAILAQLLYYGTIWEDWNDITNR